MYIGSDYASHCTECACQKANLQLEASLPDRQFVVSRCRLLRTDQWAGASRW